MAVSPLFTPSEAYLKQRVRLSSMDTSSDAQEIFAEAVLLARQRFYIELGAARVSAILGTALTDTPTNDAQVLRSLAASTEVMVVRCELFRLLPSAFMDASGDVNKRWNEEAPVREAGGEEMETYLRECEDRIVENMQRLADNDASGCDDVQVFDGSPVCPTPRVGRSLMPSYRRFRSNDPSCNGGC